jgi:chitodextrinase
MVAAASQINLAWGPSTDAVGVTGYRVERCQGPNCSAFAQIASPPRTALSDTGLASSTSYSYRVRATDAKGNLSDYSNVATATTTGAGATSCPCTIWPPSATPTLITDPDRNAVELGVKFRADSDGFITGIRFYKGPQNTGKHTGHLWTSTGTLLATVTFSNETASGWQQATFSAPVPISANTVYIASYHTRVGRYSADTRYFSSQGVDTPPLHALAGANGVYRYGSRSRFPNQTYQSSNYWVDVIFIPR